MRNRVLLAAGTLALVPTLMLAQQRPAQQPAQRPAAQPAQRPAAQPAQRPTPAPARPMAGPHREGTWELTAGVGVTGVGAVINDGSSTAFMPGGTLRVGYNLNPMWNISVGSGLGYGGANKTAYLTPGAAVTWTPDINKPTSPFVLLGVGLVYVKSPPAGVSTSNAGVQVGVGIRHMIGDNLAVRVEGGATVGSINSTTTGAGHATVGLSLFAGAKKVLTNIAVNPGSATLASLRATQQFSATALDQRGGAMTGKMFQWRSSNPAVATVSASGLVTAMGDGSATITATSEGVSGSANVMVSRTAASVAVTPATATLNALGATQQLSAAARDANNNPLPGATFTWTSNNAAVASVSASGLVTAVANGTAQITATSGGRSASAAVTVSQTVASVVVTPTTSPLTAAGATAQLSAQAMDANGRPVSGKTFTWSSDATGVATVNASGVATAVANGVAHVSASVDGRSGSGTVTVIVAARGAPPVELPTMPAVGATPMVLRNVTFRTTRAGPVLTPAAEGDLDKIAIAIQATPNSRWEIGGYTSNLGPAARNTRLSQQRAEAVRTYLVSKGVAAASITAAGYGPARPIANNRTAAGRAENNRVELKRVQ